MSNNDLSTMAIAKWSHLIMGKYYYMVIIEMGHYGIVQYYDIVQIIWQYETIMTVLLADFAIKNQIDFFP